MRRKNVTNQIIRESITQALLLLMKTQPFAQITITDIVKKAGVGRVSFYRNFAGKEDVLLTYLNEAAQEWWRTFPRERSDYLRGVLEHCGDIREPILLLYRQGLGTLLWQNLRELIGPSPEDDTVRAYQKSCLVGALFGVLSEWIRRDMVESPAELSAQFDAREIDAMVRALYA